MKKFIIHSQGDHINVEAKTFRVDSDGIFFYDLENKIIAFAPKNSVVIQK